MYTKITEQYLTYLNLSNMQGGIYLYPEIVQTQNPKIRPNNN